MRMPIAGQREVDDEELHQERRVADQLDVRRDRRPHRPRPGVAQERAARPRARSRAANAPTDRRMREPRAFEQPGKIVPDDAELEDVVTSHPASAAGQRAMPRAKSNCRRQGQTGRSTASRRYTSCRSWPARRCACSGTPRCAGIAAGRNRPGARRRRNTRCVTVNLFSMSAFGIAIGQRLRPRRRDMPVASTWPDTSACMRRRDVVEDHDVGAGRRDLRHRLLPRASRASCRSSCRPCRPRC